MRRSRVLEKIRAGQVARICSMGHFLPFYPKHAAQFGFDGIMVDGEHRAWDAREVQSMIAFHHLADVDCLWRPPTLEKSGLYRLLEDGVAGLIIPFVDDAAKAHRLVEAVKFPPLGNRGMDGAGLDVAFTLGTPNYREEANRESCLIGQIETTEALANVETIVATPGIDVLFIGPGALAMRLGTKASIKEPVFHDAQKRVAAAARKHGKAWGRPAFDVEDARILKEEGAQLIVMGNDFVGLYQHLRETQERLDTALGK